VDEESQLSRDGALIYFQSLASFTVKQG